MNQAAILALGAQTETRIIEADDTGVIFHILDGQTGAQGCALIRSDIAAVTEFTGTRVTNEIACTEAQYALIADPGTSYPTTKFTITDAVDLVFNEAHAANHTLSAAECYGAFYVINAAARLTLPAGANGMSLTVTTRGAVAGSVKAGAADFIYLDGVALDNGDKITNSSTSGDTVVLFANVDGNWSAITDGNWTDTGA